LIHKVTKKQQNSKMCIACGMKNPFGLKAFFYELENNELVAIFKTVEEHQSYPGRLHGGIAATIMDETIGRAILAGREEDVWGVTLEFNIQYKKPIPLNEELKVVGRITEEEERIFKGTGELYLKNGEIAAFGKGVYMKLPLESIADFDFEENEWRVIASDNDPEKIDIPKEHES
jgi:acyl-coenzyme A thioesterase PaaI-like protein